MIAIDSSVAVPALTAAHPDHARAHAYLVEHHPALPAHAALETYAVLTRLPAPAGVSASIAAELVVRNFAGRILHPEADPLDLLAEFGAAGLIGGAVYDALIGATVRAAGGSLTTDDRRAAGTYLKVGAEVSFLGTGA